MKWSKVEPGEYEAHVEGATFGVHRRTGGRWLAFYRREFGTAFYLEGGPWRAKHEAVDACERLRIRWLEEAAR